MSTEELETRIKQYHETLVKERCDPMILVTLFLLLIHNKNMSNLHTFCTEDISGQ